MKKEMLILNLSDGANFNAAMITLEWRSLIRLYLANCFLLLIQGNKTVSYTHLDVYKRQIICRFKN